MVLGLVVQAGNLRASAFRVTPVQIHMNGKSSTLLTLTNESDTALRFQISAFAWTQGPKGEIQLAPTDDITFFPALLTLAAGQERKVRVGSNTPAADVEKTYRIFFEELPPAETTGQKPNEVKILTKMGIPIFIAPDTAVAAGKVSDLKLTGSNVTFRVTNSGSAHFSIHKVHLTLGDDAGSKVYERDLDGWYVLAGGYREYRMEVPADVCRKVSTVTVDVNTDIVASGTASQLTSQQRFPSGSACNTK
jgi:fimbrial chaperone protein